MGDLGFSMEPMMEMFLFETTSLLEQLDEILIEVEKNSSIDDEHINEIFRIMHTIKGSAAMMSVNNVATVAHVIEDLFYFVRENGLDDGYYTELCELVFEGNDFIKEQVDNLQNGIPPSASADDLEGKIKALLAKMSGKPVAENKDAPAAKVDGSAEKEPPVDLSKEQTQSESKAKEDGNKLHTVKVYLEDGCEMENMRAFLLVNNLSEYCDKLTYSPDDIMTNSESAKIIIEKGFTITFENLVDLSEIAKVIEQTPHVKTYQFIGNTENVPMRNVDRVSPQKQSAVEEKIKNEQNLAVTEEVKTANQAVQAAQSGAAVKAPKQNLINVSLAKLDMLMDIVGEIVITESMVTSSPDLQGLNLDNFSKSARQLRKLTDEMQDTVMSIRMIPVSGAFQKMFRIVRDMCKKLEKDVDLKLSGEDTEVDKTIIDTIGDPLMHLVRNAMDHAIEMPEERKAAGKPERGTILLSATNNGGEVLITVSDDGKGLDPARILEKARNNGLLTKAESEYSEKEILHMIMLPGFSTKDKVTEFSGRGVGMDVVKKNIEKVGGTVTIESKKGVGTNIIFRIPLTLAIVDGMEFSVGKSIYTIPITAIKQSFKIEDESVISDTDGHEMVMIRGECYPIIRLHQLYKVDTEITSLMDGILIQVETDEKSACLFADKLVGEQQVVVKPFPPYLSKFKVKEYGVTGCTILGDGSISLILDASGIIESYT